jgi:hypothetical protein
MDSPKRPTDANQLAKSIIDMVDESEARPRPGMSANGAYRLDRWTGSIVACAQLNNPPDNLDCEPKK